MTTDTRTLLLAGWEEVYKKSQLTLWMLLALKDGPKSMADIKTFIDDRTAGHIGADDKSMYRALRRFDEADLITSTTAPSSSGPDIKIWRLTDTGVWVLATFIERNIHNLILNPKNHPLFS